MDTTRKYKILCCCGCGNGTCQILALTTRKACNKLGITATVEPFPVSVAVAQSNSYDMVICNQGLLRNFEKVNTKAKIIGLKNITSDVEIAEKITEAYES